MSKYSHQDSYIDPETGVLKNVGGFKTEAELERFEATFTVLQSLLLAKKPLKGKFDFQHLKDIHQFLFCQIYEWAGQIRTIDIKKGGSSFAHAKFIESGAVPVFKSLKEEKHLKGLSKPDFAIRAAHYLGEINALHPFREGNGRAQREFISHLAYNAGYKIDWNNITSDDMITASAESFGGDCSKFADYIGKNLSDLENTLPPAKRSITPKTGI